MLTNASLGHVTVRVTLSRNDAKRFGLSRKDLLAVKLDELPLCNRDIVVYVDECVIGSNFRTICELVSKIAKTAGAFFLPGAALGPQAAEHERFVSFCEYHDRLLWGGQTGDSFRVRFPAL